MHIQLANSFPPYRPGLVQHGPFVFRSFNFSKPAMLIIVNTLAIFSAIDKCIWPWYIHDLFRIEHPLVPDITGMFIIKPANESGCLVECIKSCSRYCANRVILKFDHIDERIQFEGEG